MIELFIAGIAVLVFGTLLFRILDKRDSRWSNMVLALSIIIGVVCIGLFAWL